MRGDGDLEASYRENISGRWHALWETPDRRLSAAMITPALPPGIF
jgi:hypothetical protein